MIYEVIEAEYNYVSIWDGKTRDKHHEPAGVLTVFTDNTDGEYKVGDKVKLKIHRLEDE